MERRAGESLGAAAEGLGAVIPPRAQKNAAAGCDPRRL
jgi:hypothetical protein